MSSNIRRVVLWISAPVIAFAIVGGFIGKVTAREDTYPHLRVFYDVVNLITDRYVEKADSDKVIVGQDIIVLGSPQGLEGTVSTGIVGGLRTLGAARLLQITAPIR